MRINTNQVLPAPEPPSVVDLPAPEAQPSMAGTLLCTVEQTAFLKPEEARALRRLRIKLQVNVQDVWGAAYIDVEEPSDVTAMVDKALKASGFTGKEKRFQELPR